MRGEWYQIALILLGVLVTALFGVFLYREFYPEYRIYQNDYVALENFRSTYSGQPPPPFEMGIKQIVIPSKEGGPATIDRCTSCHVALQFSHFSPTKIERDVNGNIVYLPDGIPNQVPNEDDIWKKLDEKIDDLMEKGNIVEAEKLQALKTARVGDHVYDVTKVLRMHPLIGRETRPFEYHPIEEYGCTSCHNGNGRGLTTEKAHGPIFDETYETQFMGPRKEFLEVDAKNDPRFSKVFNFKPGHELLFQTTPLYVGALIEAKCMQCHQSSQEIFQQALRETEVMTMRRKEQAEAVEKAFHNEKKSLVSFLHLRNKIKNEGYEATLEDVQKKSQDFSLPEGERLAAQTQLSFLLKNPGKRQALTIIERDVSSIVGQREILQELFETLDEKDPNLENNVERFIEERVGNPGATGTIFAKKAAVEKEQEALFHVKSTEESFRGQTTDAKILATIPSQIDRLTKDFHRGENLFISQACYACHRINGLFRGGVGPELTEIGNYYPWFIKESIVWPQADLPTSTMPNYRLDHEELEDLVTYLLAQTGRRKSVSETSYRTALLEWEAGKKMPWETPINPGNLNDVRYGMTIFATEGCAACHRLKGFTSNVGYHVEKIGNVDFETLYREREWFENLFPEMISGSEIVAAIEKNAEEIDRRIVDDVRKDSILEELEAMEPQLIESFYSNFKYAMRARNYLDEGNNKEEWEKRVRRLLMMYVQEYGLGRLVGPRPNWSGIYRSDEWLVEHFRKPSMHTPRSIMPAMPFDDSKFYALTYMLDALAIKNRDAVREVWSHFGFDPSHAYQTLCSQCHGEYLHGNGPVSEWIYPIPKNLRNVDFLRNFTRENVSNSIQHGVKGTPMPPWGEVHLDKPFAADKTPVLTTHEIAQLVDWLFASPLGGASIPGEEDVPKWDYQPKDVIEELKKEGNILQPGPPPEFPKLQETEPDTSMWSFPTGDTYCASLTPVIARSSNPSSEQEDEVQKIFDVIPNPQPGPEKNLYYIKKKFYTEENIQEGHEFFELNCAVCHGAEADGMGFRAGSMYDAKPRMFTNLHWMDTRDDLRLLRSIKYGVPGTAMTPWGDQTSSLQRLQLVIFIRSLNLEQEERDELFKAIYMLFDEADQVLDRARVEENQQANILKQELQETKARLLKLHVQIASGEAKSEEATALFLQELSLSRKLKQHEELDDLLVKLKETVKEEGEAYQALGVTLIHKTIMGDTFEKYLQLLEINNGQYHVKNGKLEAQFSEKKEQEIQSLGNNLIKGIENQIAVAENKKIHIEGKLPSLERNKELESIRQEILLLKNVQHALISSLEEAKRLRQRQKDLFVQYEEKLKQLEAAS